MRLFDLFKRLLQSTTQKKALKGDWSKQGERKQTFWKLILKLLDTFAFLILRGFLSRSNILKARAFARGDSKMQNSASKSLDGATRHCVSKISPKRYDHHGCQVVSLWLRCPGFENYSHQCFFNKNLQLMFVGYQSTQKYDWRVKIEPKMWA